MYYYIHNNFNFIFFLEGSEKKSFIFRGRKRSRLFLGVGKKSFIFRGRKKVRDRKRSRFGVGSGKKSDPGCMYVCMCGRCIV